MQGGTGDAGTAAGYRRRQICRISKLTMLPSVTMDWHLSPISFALLCNAVLCCLLAWVSWQRRPSPGAGYFTGVLLGFAVWTFCAGVEMAVVARDQKILWSQAAYLGEMAAPPFFLLAVSAYTGQRTLPTPRLRWLLFVPSVIIVALVWTNGWHGLVWSGFAPGPEGSNQLIYLHGPAFWLAVAYIYAMVSAVAFVLAVAAHRAPAPYRQQAVRLLLAAVAPLIGGLLYLIEIPALAGIDSTPLSLIVTTVVFAWALLAHRLLDMAPVAHQVVLANISDGVLVVDGRERLADLNPAAQRLLGVSTAAIGSPLSAILPPAVVSAAQHGGEVLVGQDAATCLELHLHPLAAQSAANAARVVVVYDITERRQTELAMQALNARLERQVLSRTEELRATVRDLEEQVRERQRAEAELCQVQEGMAQRMADQSRKLAALYEVILAAGHDEGVDATLTQSLEQVMAAVGSSAACLHALTADRNSLSLVAQCGLPDRASDLLANQSPGWLLGDGEPRTAPVVNTGDAVPSYLREWGAAVSLVAPVWSRGQPWGMLTAYWRHVQPLSVEDIALFSAMADQLGIIIENARLRQADEEAAVLQERQRLARDLHDSVAQALHSLVLHADIATHRLSQGWTERAAAALPQLMESARQALKDMRLLLYELRPVTVEEDDLAGTIRQRLETVERRSGVEAQVTVTGEGGWPRGWNADLLAITMEALNNALKHARASQIAVSIDGSPEHIRLQVTDNGIGFEVLSHRSGGMGLQTMNERAERLHGHLWIQSAPGQGTQVCLEAPTGG